MAYVYAAAYVACLPLISARGPSGLVVRASDYYSEGLGFESQLDPGFFSVDLFLTLSTKIIIHECLLSLTVRNIKPLNVRYMLLFLVLAVNSNRFQISRSYRNESNYSNKFSNSIEYINDFSLKGGCSNN